METQEQESKPVVTEPVASTKPLATQTYFFPNDNVSIEAVSKEEAEIKLAALRNTK